MLHDARRSKDVAGADVYLDQAAAVVRDLSPAKGNHPIYVLEAYNQMTIRPESDMIETPPPQFSLDRTPC